MRFLGVDLGRARIGLALADDILRTARPLRTVTRRGEDATLADIGVTAREYEVTQLVVGLPLNMDGTEGPAARHARAFAAKLSGALGLPAALQDPAGSPPRSRTSGSRRSRRRAACASGASPGRMCARRWTRRPRR
jgi:putative transcription antitermination factor YqgF